MIVFSNKRFPSDVGLGASFLHEYLGLLTALLKKHKDPGAAHLALILRDQLSFMTRSAWVKKNGKISYLVDPQSAIGDCGAHTRPEALGQIMMAQYFFAAADAMQDGLGGSAGEIMSADYLNTMFRFLRSFDFDLQTPGGVRSPGLLCGPKGHKYLCFHPYTRGSCGGLPRVALNQAAIVTRNPLTLAQGLRAWTRPSGKIDDPKNYWPRGSVWNREETIGKLESRALSTLYSYAFAPSYSRANPFELPALEGFLNEHRANRQPFYWFHYDIDLSNGAPWETSDDNYCGYNAHIFNGIGAALERVSPDFGVTYRVSSSLQEKYKYAYAEILRMRPARNKPVEVMGQKNTQSALYNVFLSEINPTTRRAICRDYQRAVYCRVFDFFKGAFFGSGPLPEGSEYYCQGVDGLERR